MNSTQSEQDKRFEENLAVGEAGEDIVYSYLTGKVYLFEFDKSKIRY